MLEAAQAREPHARPGWAPAAGTPFVVVREGGRPVVGAAIERDPVTTGRWSASAICLEPDATATTAAGLIDVLEAIAFDGGGTHLRLDATAFLAGERLGLTQRGYVAGPPYHGDADVEVWTECELGV